jgi:quercetin dioxygenase-like cupin family protein
MDKVKRPRRVVTGHDADGQAVVVEDEALRPAPLAETAGLAGAVFFQLWATHEMPVDASDATFERQRGGSTTTVVGSGKGSVLRIGELAPGTRSPMHRTQSLDYGILLEGTCDLELDGGDVVTLRAGDVVIQRGTNHLWHNRSAAPCRFAWILLDAQPLVVDGQPLATNWIDDE